MGDTDNCYWSNGSYFIMCRNLNSGHIYPVVSGEDVAIWSSRDEAEQWAIGTSLLQCGQVRYEIYVLP